MIFSRRCVVVAALCCACVAVTVQGRRLRRSSDSSGDIDDSAQEQRRQVVTYIDTLNRGRELRLGRDDVGAVAEPRRDGQEEGAAAVAGPVDGFRIQCFASNNIDAVRSHKKNLESKIDFPLYIVFVEPYYKLHAGDFTARAEAEAALAKIRQAGYGEAWIVRSGVLPPKQEGR